MAHAFEVPNAQSTLIAAPRIPAANDNDVRTFSLDEAVRRLTAGKGYKPAPQWTLCATCGQPVSSFERIAKIGDVIHHEVCR